MSNAKKVEQANPVRKVASPVRQLGEASKDVHTPDYKAIRKRIAKRFPKTIAYLAK